MIKKSRWFCFDDLLEGIYYVVVFYSAIGLIHLCYSCKQIDNPDDSDQFK